MNHIKEPFPLVDLASLTLGNSEKVDLDDIGRQILDSFDNYGFVYLKNYGVTHEQITKYVSNGDKFFDLDEKTKLKYQRNMETFNGYMNKNSYVIDASVEDDRKANVNFYDTVGLYEKFPSEVPELKISVKPIIENILPTVRYILKALEKALGTSPGLFTNNHKLMMQEGNLTGLRLIRYEPPSKQEEEVRLEEHFDFSNITFQLYGDLEGLQIRDKKGIWQHALFIPGYALLFTGEVMQRWTADRIMPLRHRVVIPEDSYNQRKPRHALILFVHTDSDTEIISYNGSNKYEPIKSKDFVLSFARRYFSKLFDQNNKI